MTRSRPTGSVEPLKRAAFILIRKKFEKLQDFKERYEVLTSDINITVLMDLTLCNAVEIHRRFGRTYCLHLKGKEC
jgi:hypothetical protein